MFDEVLCTSGGVVRIAKWKNRINDFHQKKGMICFENLVNNCFHGQ